MLGPPARRGQAGGSDTLSGPQKLGMDKDMYVGPELVRDVTRVVSCSDSYWLVGALWETPVGCSYIFILRRNLECRISDP